MRAASVVCVCVCILPTAVAAEENQLTMGTELLGQRDIKIVFFVKYMYHTSLTIIIQHHLTAPPPTPAATTSTTNTTNSCHHQHHDHHLTFKDVVREQSRHRGAVLIDCFQDCKDGKKSYNY